jgi:hypothetical protein
MLRRNTLPKPAWRQGDERLVHYSNQMLVESSGDPLRAVGALLPLWVPTSVVSDRGLLRRIEGAGQLRKLVTDMVEPQFKNADQGRTFIPGSSHSTWSRRPLAPNDFY